MENSKGILNPVTQRKLEEEISRLKNENNQKLELFHSELVKTQQVLTENELIIQNERKKYNELQKEQESLRDEKQVNLVFYF